MTSRNSSAAGLLTLVAVLLVTPCGAPASGDNGLAAEVDQTYILVTGRRLPFLYAISLEDAVIPANTLTENAIVGRSKVALDGLNGRPLGDPANLVVKSFWPVE